MEREPAAGKLKRKVRADWIICGQAQIIWRGAQRNRCDGKPGDRALAQQSSRKLTSAISGLLDGEYRSQKTGTKPVQVHSFGTTPAIDAPFLMSSSLLTKYPRKRWQICAKFRFFGMLAEQHAMLSPE